MSYEAVHKTRDVLVEFTNYGGSTGVVSGNQILSSGVDAEVAGVVAHGAHAADYFEGGVEHHDESVLVFCNHIIISVMLKDV
jgi:hypothetical protein